MIDVTPKQLGIILNILKKNISGVEARAFGSRITGKYKDYSDLDIAVMGKEKLSDDIFYALKADFEESDLPFRVDVLDWHRISEEFKQVINKQYEIIQSANSADAKSA